MSLALGHINYLNCVPFFHHLACCGYHGRITSGVPAELNALLLEDAIDVSPSSSFEYGRHWERYLLLPDLSISSDGPVGSVLLFSDRALSELEDIPIAVTGESATSVNLMRVVLREWFGVKIVCDYVPEEPVETLIAQGQPVLLIGDLALQAAASATTKVYDLGQIWKEKTGLPFVFALWIVREEVAEYLPGELKRLSHSLRLSLKKALNEVNALAEEYSHTKEMTAAAIVDYWQQMSFGLSPRHQQGLLRFFALCVKYDLLPEVPQLRFFKA